MILEGNARGHGAELARHLMNPRDNDHVTLHRLDGFVADDLEGAFAEAEAISGATQCRKYLFSLSLNPPKDAEAPVEMFEAAISDVEARLGLSGQPRAIVFHEKNGRRHAHCVWSRIDAGAMKAIRMSHFKRKLTDLSREIYLQHGWEMPRGFVGSEDRDPLNYSRAEAGQAKRLKRDASAMKALFRVCWEASDSRAGFEAALSEYGFTLARGERRGFVGVDAGGKIWSLSRWCGVKPREMRARLGPERDLPSATDVNAQMREGAPRPDAAKTAPPDPGFEINRDALITRQRAERRALLAAQEQRREAERRARAAALPKGLRKQFFKVTGRYHKLVADAERATEEADRRDRTERQEMITRHLTERRALDRKHPRRRDAPAHALVLPRDDQALTPDMLRRDPSRALAELSKTKASFTRTDLLRYLAKIIEDPRKLGRIADAALASEAAISLPSDGPPRFTTRDYQQAEQRLHAVAAQMPKPCCH